MLKLSTVVERLTRVVAGERKTKPQPQKFSVDFSAPRFCAKNVMDCKAASCKGLTA